MKNLIFLLLIVSSVCKAQMSDTSASRDYYTTVFSGGLLVGHRWYDYSKTQGNPTNHFTYGANIEANMKIDKQFYTGFGFEINTYSVSNGTLYIYNQGYQEQTENSTSFSLYVQPSAAFNLYKGNATFFTGARTNFNFGGRSLVGFSISPFVRLQYNFEGNACIGYHIGAQKFSEGGFKGDYYGYALNNYFYFGIRLRK
jgi:hypothetical protein